MTTNAKKSSTGKIAVRKVFGALISTIKYYYLIVVIKVIVLINIAAVITLLNLKSTIYSNSNP